MYICDVKQLLKKIKMKTINASTILKVAKRNVISNDIIFYHNDVKYSVIYDVIDKDFILQAVNENGEYVRIAKILL
jgi:hypothetical protein